MIDHAHTPESLENILSTVREYTQGKVICVFGCGGDRDAGKDQLWEKYQEYMQTIQ